MQIIETLKHTGKHILGSHKKNKKPFPDQVSVQLESLNFNGWTAIIHLSPLDAPNPKPSDCWNSKHAQLETKFTSVIGAACLAVDVHDIFLVSSVVLERDSLIIRLWRKFWCIF